MRIREEFDDSQPDMYASLDTKLDSLPTIIGSLDALLHPWLQNSLNDFSNITPKSQLSIGMFAVRNPLFVQMAHSVGRVFRNILQFGKV